MVPSPGGQLGGCSAHHLPVNKECKKPKQFTEEKEFCYYHAKMQSDNSQSDSQSESCVFLHFGLFWRCVCVCGVTYTLMSIHNFIEVP